MASIPDHAQFVNTELGDRLILKFQTEVNLHVVSGMIDNRIDERHRDAFGIPVPQGHRRAVWYRLLYFRTTPDSTGRTYHSVEDATWDWVQTTPPISPPASARTGVVQINGRAFSDDGGVYKALGATYMSAIWWCRNDRTRFRAQLAWLAAHGIHYIRILMMVGHADDQRDYWQGRWFFPSQAGYQTALLTVFRDCQEFGLRIQPVLIDHVEEMETSAARIQWLRDIAPFIINRKKQIQCVEIFNEYERQWSSAELASLCQVWVSLNTGTLLMPSAPRRSEPGFNNLFSEQNLTVDLLGPHFDRDSREDGYRPHRQPWETQFYNQPNTTVFTNNEGVGPGSSVVSETDPGRMAMGLANTFVSRGAGFVYHCSEGVRGDRPFSETPNGEAILTSLQFVMGLLPDNIANGQVQNHHWSGHPYQNLNQIWPNTNRTTGIVRAYAMEVDNVFYIPVMGMKVQYDIKAKFDMEIEVWDANPPNTRYTFISIPKGGDLTFQLGPNGSRDAIHVVRRI